MSSKKNLRKSFSSSRSRSSSRSSSSSGSFSTQSSNSRSSSSNSKSSRSKSSKSDFSSDFSDKSDNQKERKDSKKSLASSRESVVSFASLNSYSPSEDEFQSPEYQNLPLNVLQLLLSIRDSEISIKKLKFKHEANVLKLKYSIENKSELTTENEKLEEELLKETSGIVALNEVVYGTRHLKSAWSHINLALIYLECKNLPKQAKNHCEKSWQIQTNILKSDGSYDEIDDKHEMINNFVYGRACMLLKENTESESCLEKAEEHFYNWRTVVEQSKNLKKMGAQIFKWQKKVLFALAKIYAINGSYKNALVYYDKLIDILTKRKDRILSKTNNIEALNEIDQVLIEIYEDKSKVEQNRDNFREAADAIKEAIKIAELSSDVLLANCKFSLAKVYNQLDDLTSSNNAENLFKESIQLYENVKNTERILKVEDEMVKFFLKQERLDEACDFLTSLVKKQIDFYGDFSLKVSGSYKVLCSIYLKRNDMPNAAKFLQKSYELEELNYGPRHKKTLSTKGTLDNLKKNPNVIEKLKKNLNKIADKPNFKAVKKIDYSKDDKKLYSNADEEIIKKLINPLK